VIISRHYENPDRDELGLVTILRSVFEVDWIGFQAADLAVISAAKGMR
jgi:hypothetical protein